LRQFEAFPRPDFHSCKRLLTDQALERFTSSHRLADILFANKGRVQAAPGGKVTAAIDRRPPKQKTVGSVMARLDLNSHGPEEGASAGGTSDALLQLGLTYCVGRDVDVDLIEAHKWFNLAALRGNEEAKRHREEIARDMSKIDIARAQRLAREWVAAH
jgi:hypothetical protein